MNVLVATDGSKYGGWALNWAAMLPLVQPPKITALHVLDVGETPPDTVGASMLV